MVEVEALINSVLLRREHVRSVSLEKDSVGWELAEDFSKRFFPRMEKVSGEGKVSSEFDEFASGLKRAIE